MKHDNKLLDDLAKIAGNAVGSLVGIKSEVETIICQKLETYFHKMNLVSREEFDVVKEMAANARAEQQRLEERIKELEALLKND
jgi:BMFP domain-containing protein YqiC